VVELLAQNGVDLNAKHKSSDTQLSLAAAEGHDAVLELLFAKDGVDPDSIYVNSKSLIATFISTTTFIHQKYNQCQLLKKD
jgi:ankyrin repeat protein